MLFNSLPFLMVFLPAALAGFYLLARFGGKVAAPWLILVSLFFYYWWDPPYVLLLLGSVAMNFTFGVLIQRSEAKPRLQMSALVAGIAFDLGLLCYYKYLFPLLGTLEKFGMHFPEHPATTLLPLGISFFTFTQIGYLVDCKAGLARSQKLVDYSLFVTFFPHLIAGPILHHKEMMPQFREASTYRFQPQTFQLGLSVFLLGLAKRP